MYFARELYCFAYYKLSSADLHLSIASQSIEPILVAELTGALQRSSGIVTPLALLW